MGRRGRGRRPYSYTKTRLLAQPDATFVKLRYTDQIYNTPSTAGPVVQTYQYYGNSCGDADATAGGAQAAQGFTTYTRQYNKWVVMACKIRVQFFNQQNDCRMVSVTPFTYDGTPLGSGSNLLNKKLSTNYVSQRLLGPEGSSKSACTISKYMTTKRLFGVSNVTNQQAFYSGGNIPPSYYWAWQVEVDNQSTSQTLVTWQATMTYYVKFFDRVQYSTD